MINKSQLGVFPTNGAAEAIAPDELRAARAVARAAQGRDVSTRMRQGFKSPHWLDLLDYVQGVPPEAADDRSERVRQYLNGREGRYPKEVAAMRRVLAAAEVAIALEPADQVDDEDPDAPPPFDLGLIDTEQFFAESYCLEWLAKGLLVKGENCVMGGPQKTLKTSLLIELVICLNSQARFIGRFEVPRSIRVGLISGESGRRVIQANAKQVCIAKGIPFTAAAGVFWGFTLPQLSNAEHLAVLRKTIGDLGLEAIGLDPLYLSLLAGSSGIDPKDMFQMGPLLADVSQACLEAGATPILAHHFVKRREDPYGPPELEDLAYSGIGQFMRQWVLLSRRERFDAEAGVHKLHFRYGGSAGHCGDLQLDIETGRVDEDFNGRRWNVTVATPTEGIVAKQERRKAEMVQKAADRAAAARLQKDFKDREEMAEAIKVIGKERGSRTTLRRLRNLTGWNADKAGRIVRLLVEGSYAKPVKVPFARGKTTEEADGIEIIDGGGLAP